jgi:hypothetical protein
MKKFNMMERILLCAAILFLTQLVGCGNKYELEDYSKVEADRANLTLGLVSYMSLEDVKEALVLQAKDIIVTDDNSNPSREGIPPFNVLTIKILNSEIDSFKGAVSFTFFNDRLMEIRFFPVDADGFIQSIDGLSQSNTITLGSFTKVWFSKDYQDATYIGWVDIRLQNQINAWIKKYS